MASAPQTPIPSPSRSRAQLELLQSQSGALRGARTRSTASAAVRSPLLSTARDADPGGEAACNADGNAPSLADAPDNAVGNCQTNKKEIKDKKHDIFNWSQSKDNAKDMDPIDHLKEQLKILSGEAAIHSDTLKHISDTDSAKKNPIEGKNEEIVSYDENPSPYLPVRSLTRNETPNLSLTSDDVLHLNEKTFELEIKSTDSGAFQNQLHHKTLKCQELRQRVASMQQKQERLAGTMESGMSFQQHSNGRSALQTEFCSTEESIQAMNIKAELVLQDKALDTDEIKQKVIVLTSERNQLEAQNKKLLEELSCTKELVSAAGAELKALSRQVAKHMKQNDTLATEVAALRNASRQRVNNIRANNTGKKNVKQDVITKRYNKKMVQQEMDASYEQELSLETALRETQQKEAELQKIVDESKKKEAYLENELARMWVLVGKLRSTNGIQNDQMELGFI